MESGKCDGERRALVHDGIDFDSAADPVDDKIVYVMNAPFMSTLLSASRDRGERLDRPVDLLCSMRSHWC